MTQTTVFQSGNSQAVRLPKEFRFKSKTVEIYRRGDEVVLREKPRTMKELLASLPPLSDDDREAPGELMAVIDEKQPPDTIERVWGLGSGAPRGAGEEGRSGGLAQNAQIPLTALTAPTALKPMRYLLDTDSVSRLARDDSPALAERFDRGEVGSFAISVVTLGELRFGQAAGVVAKAVAARTELLLRSIATLPLGESVVPHYAHVRSALRRKGTPIGPNDTWIAAHALAEGLTLITGNDREFRRVPGLQVENWLR